MSTCFNSTRATLVVVGTQSVRHGHWHGPLAVLDDGLVFSYGQGYVDGDEAEALRKEACGTVALPRTYATPAVTCQVAGIKNGRCPTYRCHHEEVA